MINNKIHFRKKAKFYLIFALMTSTAFASSYGFVDELSENDKISIKNVASKVNTINAVSDKSINKFAALFDQANDEEKTFKFTFDELLNPAYFSKTTPSFVTNGSENDAKKSFLNILGFGGKHFKDDVNIDTALKQYMPIAHIRKINGITNVFFENPAFVDKNLGENIEYYSSNIGLERLVPIQGLSDQKQHDKFLRFAFSNQGDAEDFGVQEFSSRGSAINQLSRLDRIFGAIAGKKYSSTRLPIVELIGKFYADKLNAEFGQDEKIIFSGSGFAGAVAQEVAYHAIKGGALKKDNAQVFTSQAMRYLSGQFASEFNETVGKDNVFSFNTARQRKIETTGLTHKHVHFEALGNQVRLETAAPTNGILDDTAWDLGVIVECDYVLTYTILFSLGKPIF
ncbi:MAG: hypothetical protein ACRYGR_04390 [Janthinobacterium lividum]